MADPVPLLPLYHVLLRAATTLAPLGSPFSEKVRAGLDGRAGLQQRLRDAAERLRGCIWFHVTSVGEFEQARPVITALKQRGAAPPIAVTHYSPSGMEYARKRPCADFHDYLPFDHRSSMRRLFQWWQPRLLVFVKFDFWPNQILAAAEQSVPVVLLAGSLQPRSLRLKPLARRFFRSLFDRFSHLGVCTEADRDRFRNDLKVTTPVSVTGDTRADQVILRYEAAGGGRVAQLLEHSGARLLVLGSSWPPDEELWLPILPELLDRHPDLKLVIAPHEPRPARLEHLERALSSQGIRTDRLSRRLAASAGPGATAAWRCLLVDSVGVLAEVYRSGCLAYVGGSFTTGVHNTMEPAVASLPVLFGPVIQNAHEAGDLVDRGAGFVVRRPAEALARADSLLSDPEDLTRRGRLARDVVLAQRGATQKSLALLDPYL